MASKLVGLKLSIRWADFGPPKNKPEPSPGQPGGAAFTDVDYMMTSVPSIQAVSGSKPTTYKLTDNVQIDVTFKKGTSWVAAWVFNRPIQFQNELLKHEQGHYDLVALIARDLFIDLMQLKAKIYTSAPVAQQDFNNVKQKYVGKAKKISDLYDTKTKHGRESGQQKMWDGYINKAFTEQRKPPQQAPDGVFYKVRILDVLSAAGLPV